MSNIFLFRHGNCFGADSDREQLSSDGIKQAEKAGEIVAEKLNEHYMNLKIEGRGIELEGLLKVHSGRPRTLSFLEKMFKVADENFKGQLGFYGNQINIISPEIYDDSTPKSCEKINRIVESCSSLAGIQFIVGHNPSVAYMAKSYMDKGFNFIGDEIFLEATMEGGGYWINTSDKNIQIINQPQ